uniref:Uncharacterized protein n=1 Tax=Romanomermis culicivorax TaxID=13658 RepID=A0A915JRY8_ROMCU
MDERMWQGLCEVWVVAFQQTIHGLIIGVAEAISLEGITILAADVDWQLVRTYKLVAGAAKVDGKAGRDSGSSEDCELAPDES